VFGLAFVKVAGVTDVFTEAEIHAFVMPKLYSDSAIVQLDNVSSGENTHSGRGDERFTGVLTKVFLNGIVDDTVTTNMADVTAGVDVYFLTVDGINETATNMGYVDPIQLRFALNEEETIINYTANPNQTTARKISTGFGQAIAASDNYVCFPWNTNIKFVPFDYNTLSNNAQFTDAKTLIFRHASNNINHFSVSPDNYVMFFISETSELYILDLVDIHNYCTSNSVTNVDISTLTSVELPTLFKTTIALRNTTHWGSTGFLRSNNMAINNNFAIIVDDMTDDTNVYIYYKTNEATWTLVQTINYNETHNKFNGCVQLTSTHLAFSIQTAASIHKIVIFKANGSTFEFSQELPLKNYNGFAMNNLYLISSGTTNSNLQLYMLDGDIWVYKNEATVSIGYRSYNNQSTVSYKNLSLYGNRVIIGHPQGYNGQVGGVLTYHINTVNGITYKSEVSGYSLPNRGLEYKYYGSQVDLHRHVLFIYGDGFNTYAYWT